MKFGCQARSFGEGIYADEKVFLDAVRQMGEVGFEGIETNWKNLERYFSKPADFVAILKAANLSLAGAHMGGHPWVAAPSALLSDVARTAQFVKAVGGEAIVFSGSIPKDKPPSAEVWRQMADFVNEIGDICAGKGVQCLYHNHWWECEGNGLDLLNEYIKPKTVWFAFDTGHATRAGKDPAKMIALLGGKLRMIHLADFDERTQTPGKRPPLGEGRLNIPAVAEALRKVGFDKWVVLEEETQVGAARAQVEKGLAVFQSTFGKGK